MAYKFIVTKPGYNALTETNTNNMILSSDYGTLKYLPSGGGTLSQGIGPSSTFPIELTVTHNLGYYPFFLAVTNAGYAGSPTRYYPMSYTFADAFADFAVYAYTTTTQLIFRIASSSGVGGSTTVYVRYQIYRNNLNL